MTKIPKSLLDGMCIQVEPYIGNIDRDKLYAFLTAMKRDRDTIRNLAALHSISVQVLRKRIRAAGIAPVGKGGPTGQESIFLSTKFKNCVFFVPFMPLGFAWRLPV